MTGAAKRYHGAKPVEPSSRDRAFAAADARMRQAKEVFSEAVLATLRNRPDAVKRTREALQAVDEARAELRRLADQDEDLQKILWAAKPRARAEKRRC